MARDKIVKRTADAYGHSFPGTVKPGDVNVVTPNGIVHCEGQRTDQPGKCTVRNGVLVYEPPMPWAGNRTGEG